MALVKYQPRNASIWEQGYDLAKVGYDGGKIILGGELDPSNYINMAKDVYSVGKDLYKDAKWGLGKLRQVGNYIYPNISYKGKKSMSASGPVARRAGGRYAKFGGYAAPYKRYTLRNKRGKKRIGRRRRFIQKKRR